MDKARVKDILRKCWSNETSTKWTPENPARGQCSVTALIVYDHFGGRILKTGVDGQWHFYNQIGSRTYDFTAEQCNEAIEYSDTPASRSDALSDTNQEQYDHLSKAFKALWDKTALD